jgi:hypothetical protein
MSIWAALMVLFGGLYAGGAATFAWSRVPIWRTMPVSPFVDDFSQTIRRRQGPTRTLGGGDRHLHRLRRHS